MKQVTILRPALAAAAALLFSIGCGDDGPGGPGAGDMEEARAVLAADLAGAIESRGAGAYAALLHPSYRFTFAEGDAPSDLSGSFWGKRTESAAIEALLEEPGVESIAVEIRIATERMDTIAGGDGAWEYRAEATLEATIAGAPLGEGGAGSATVASAESFVLREDPAGGAWKLYDEVDRGAPAKRASSAVESLRWGEAKALFHEPLGAPASRTITGAVRLGGEAGSPLAGATVTAGASETTTDANGLFEIAGVPPSVTSCAITHPGALFKVFEVGGGDDVFRVDVAAIAHAIQGTPAEAIELEFPLAYIAMDSVLYASLLDSRYTFVPLPLEVDPDDPDTVWDRAEELRIAGKMFKGRAGHRGVVVDGIDLSLHLKTNPVIDATAYPGRPAGETWYKATAFVDLTVITSDPNASDGSGIVNYIVNSDQYFVMRPDPAHAGRYLVYEQTDGYSINKAGETVSATNTDETSWGRVKSIFR